MVYEELKRRLFTRYVLFSVITILILTVGLSLTLVNGGENLKETLKEESVYAGEMTEDKLLLGLTKVRDEKSNKARYETLVIFVQDLVNTYPGVLYQGSNVQDYPDDYAKSFYSCWRKKSSALIEKIPQKDRVKALKELEQVKTPFVKYPGCDIWTLGIDNLKIIYMMVLFMVTFFAAATYSDSMEDGSMDIIYATRNGKRMMMYRLLPITIYGLLLVLISTVGIVLILGSATGFQALNSSLKVFALFSIGNFTLGEGILLMFVSEFLGVLALTTIMGWISYSTAKTSLASSIGIVINVFYIITTLFIEIPWKFSQFILNFFPLAASQVIYEVAGFNFDLSIWRPYAIMLRMVLMFITFAIILVVSIQGKISYESRN